MILHDCPTLAARAGEDQEVRRPPSGDNEPRAKPNAKEEKDAAEKKAEEARKKAEEIKKKTEEAKRRADELKKKKAEEAKEAEKKKKAEEAKRKADDAKKKAEEAKKKEEARKKQEEIKKKADAEAKKKAEEAKKKEAKKKEDIKKAAGRVGSRTEGVRVTHEVTHEVAKRSLLPPCVRAWQRTSRRRQRRRRSRASSDPDYSVGCVRFVIPFYSCCVLCCVLRAMSQPIFGSQLDFPSLPNDSLQLGASQNGDLQSLLLSQQAIPLSLSQPAQPIGSPPSPQPPPAPLLPAVSPLIHEQKEDDVPFQPWAFLQSAIVRQEDRPHPSLQKEEHRNSRAARQVVCHSVHSMHQVIAFLCADAARWMR